MSTILIAMYNFKGGVGKTTATYNLGYILSRLGLKVLMVDADPQANLTGLIWSEKYEPTQYDHEIEDYPLTEAEIFYQQAAEAAIPDENGHKSYYTLGELFKGLLSREQPQDLSDADSVRLFEVHDYQKLYLLPGHQRISGLDQLVALGVEGHAFSENIPGYFSNLFRRIGELHNIDVMLMDLNPSFGMFNGAMLTGSDYFITPFSADFFSLQAMGGVREKLPSWYREFHRRDDSRRGFGLIKTVPKFLGSYPQKIRIRKDKIERAYNDWINRIYMESEKLSQELTMGEVQLVSDHYRHVKPFGIIDFVGEGLDRQRSGRPIAHAFRAGQTRSARVFEQYVQVIELLFSNLTVEHFQALPAIFRQRLLLQGNIDVGYYANYLPVIPATPGVFSVDEDHDNRGTHNLSTAQHYSSANMNTLLNHYRNSENWTANNIVVTTTSISREHFGDALDKIELELTALSDDHHHAIAVILLNLSDDERSENKHWAALMIWYDSVETEGALEDQPLDSGNIFRFKPDTNAIFFFDPLGARQNAERAPELPHGLHALLEDRYDAEKGTYSIGRTSAQVRDVNANSGPWVIERIRSIFGEASFPRPGTREILDCRAAHREILNNSLEDVASSSNGSHSILQTSTVYGSSLSPSSFFVTPAPRSSRRGAQSSASRSHDGQSNSPSQSMQSRMKVSEASSSSSESRPPSAKALGKRPAEQTGFSLQSTKRMRVSELVLSSDSEEEEDVSPRTRRALRRNNSQDS